jgi:putative hydrolase of the HAD superfamily
MFVLPPPDILQLYRASESLVRLGNNVISGALVQQNTNLSKKEHNAKILSAEVTEEISNFVDPVETIGIEAVIFDLGRVLVQVDFTKGLFRYYNSDHQEKDIEIIDRLFNDPLFIQFTTGKISVSELYHRICFRFGIKLTYENFVKEWCNIFELIEGMDLLVQEVATNYRVGLLSDTDPLHWEYCLKTFQFLKIFERPTLSFEIGVLKPDPKCYQIAAENIGKSVPSCLFIDDRAVNVAGAQRAGMPAILFRGIDKLRKDLVQLGII